jgi:hypothetical protein
MPEYYCPNCFHSKSTDQETLLYIIDHPPQCMECGYTFKSGDQAKMEQVKVFLKKKGYRQAVKIHMLLYGSDKKLARSVVSSILGKPIAKASTNTSVTKSKKPVVWVVTVILGSLLFGLLPFLIPYMEGPEKTCMDMLYIPTGTNGSIWLLYAVGEDKDEIKIKVVDPTSGDKIAENKFDTEFSISEGDLVYNQDKIWMISNSGYSEPLIYAFNPSDASTIMNTEQFLAKSSLLKAGLASLYYTKPWLLQLTTKDGKVVYYHIKYDKFFSNTNEVNDYEAKNTKAPSQWFMLGTDPSSEHIKRIYLASPVKDTTQKKIGSSLQDVNDVYYYNMTYISDPEKVKSTLLLKKDFLDGVIVFQDEEFACIWHLNQLGTGGKSVYSGINNSGKQIFSIFEYEFFESESDYNEEQYYYTASRYEKYPSLFVITFAKNGMCGVDLNSGKILWRYWLDD